MKKLKVGVVGLGSRGRLMFSLAANSFDLVVPQAACDLLPRNWYEKRWLMDAPMCELFPNTNFYENFDEMLEKEELDVVIVETGADVHTDLCIKALEKNINVLAEIPTVASLDEADRLWKAAEKSSAMISIGANANEQKFALLLQDYFEKGKLGDPYYMEAEYIHWFKPGSDEDIGLYENGDWRRHLAPIRYCTHSLGPLLRIIPDDIRYVSCFGTGRHSDSEENLMDDMQSALFKTKSNVVIRLLRNGRCRAELCEHCYRVFGTEGYMERISYGTSDIPDVIRFNSTLDNDEKLNEVSGEFTPPKYAHMPDDLRAIAHDGLDHCIFENFFDAVINGKPAPISLKKGLEMTLPGIYAEESAKRGGELMEIHYPWDEDWKVEF